MAKQLEAWQTIRPVTSLPFTAFETEDEVAQLQRELLSFVKRTGALDRLHSQLLACGRHHCGAGKCIEACWFGARQRRLTEVPRVCRLFRQSRRPMFEVLLSRAAWSRPIGQLRSANIYWGKQFLRRALDNLYQPDTIAVGMFKAFAVGDGEETNWRCAMHYLVAGPDKRQLRDIIPHEKYHHEFASISPRIIAVDNLGQAVSRVLRRDLQVLLNPWHPNVESPIPGKIERTEFNDWLLGLTGGARLFRYGCNASFNKLIKQGRKKRTPKKRPYPHWLEPFMFGGPLWESKWKWPSS
jgi:hypothetical protein